MKISPNIENAPRRVAVLSLAELGLSTAAIHAALQSRRQGGLADRSEIRRILRQRGEEEAGAGVTYQVPTRPFLHFRRRPLVIPASNCERGHSGLVECVRGCKPRPIAKAIVMTKPGRLQRVINRVRVWLGLRAIR